MGVAQSVGFGTQTPDTSAIADFHASNKGVLIPRMMEAQRLAIQKPAKGLLVYQTNNDSGFYYNAGTDIAPRWLALASQLSAWGTRGNSGTDTAVNFLGTTDNMPLNLKVQNKEVGYIDANRLLYFIGERAGLAGRRNSALGNSVAIGHNALIANNAGRNTAVGNGAMTGIFDNSLAQQYNSAFGDLALARNTSGIQNTGIGAWAIRNNSSGSNNSALGDRALNLNTIGNNNVAIGGQANAKSIASNGNVAVGYLSLFELIDSVGNFNVAVGMEAAESLRRGEFNTAIGAYADFNSPFSGFRRINATALGARAFADCNNCIVIGSINNVNGATANAMVGIGTTQPNFPLEVRSPDVFATIANFRNAAGGFGQIFVTTEGGVTVDLGASQNTGYAGTNNAGNFVLRTNAVNRLFISDPSGHIGIGNEAPTERLDVSGNLNVRGSIKTLYSGSVVTPPLSIDILNLDLTIPELPEGWNFANTGITITNVDGGVGIIRQAKLTSRTNIRVNYQSLQTGEVRFNYVLFKL
jgi:hypothetical protein